MQKSILILAVALTGLVAVVAKWYFSSTSRQSVAKQAEAPPGPEMNASPHANREPAPALKVQRPAIISRRDWNAKEPRGEGKEHSIHCITIHHTGVPQKPGTTIEKKLQGLQNYSQNESRLASGKLKPAWLDVPYHFYISVDGKIAEGRPIKFVSDTNTEYDPTEHATIVVEGNFENEQPSAEQQASLQVLVAWLSVEYRVPSSRIKAHNDFAKTACPGTNLKKSMPALREKVDQMTGHSDNR